MCGILTIYGLASTQDFRLTASSLSSKMKHRGPDWSGRFVNDKIIICHERLAIVCPESGQQPIFDHPTQKNIIVGVNGEIYNYKEMAEEIGVDSTTLVSDCEILIHLYKHHGPDFMLKTEILGMYAFTLYDVEKDLLVCARDPIGIIPLYRGVGDNGSLWFSSEMKAMFQHCPQLENFPPGHVFHSNSGETNRFYSPDWLNLELPCKSRPSLSELRKSFMSAVKSHMMADVPYAVLLSGGLDSSLVSSIASHYLKQAGKGPLHSFAVGLEGSPDLKAAQDVANLLGTSHHEVVFTLEEGMDALAGVIEHIETFDVTTIRASTPAYLLARKIRSFGYKMVLSGEGADEIFGGYLYFHKAPNAQEFREETVRKVSELHGYDCLRANKSMMAWSIEVRVPFLDRSFMDLAMAMDPEMKMCQDPKTGKARIEKHILRAAFDTSGPDYGEPLGDEPKEWLPSSVLWRQKEQFSDGVGYSWIDKLRDHAGSMISDEAMNNAHSRFPLKTPKTKEAYFYRQIFESIFGDSKAVSGTVSWQDSIACSTETALKWDASFRSRADASGRAVLGVHDDALPSDENLMSN